jgi:putative glutamine amidotransferase
MNPFSAQKLQLFRSSSAMPAASVKLYAFRSPDVALPLVLPVREYESPARAFKRHQLILRYHPDLRALFSEYPPDIRVNSFEAVTTSDLKVSAVLVANGGKDYSPSNFRIERFKQVFGAAGKNTLLLGLAPALGLNSNERAAFHEQISENASLLVGMGGDDVCPTLYKQENIHSRCTNATRDREEMSLLKTYFNKGRGFFLGVCRGSQLAAVALGYSLIQDLPTQVGSEIPHANDYHLVHPLNTTHRHLQSAIANHIPNYYSFHHQAVVYKPGGPLELAGVGPDGVVEALEFKNGRGLLVQFHPEYTNNSLGQNFFDVIAKKT